MTNSSLTQKRRASQRVVQFTVEDCQSNVMSFERKLPPSALTSFGTLRRIAKSAMRNALKSCTVQLPGRDAIELM